MLFAKIDFINLLPFHVYTKKNINSTQIKQILEYNKSYPSKINARFKKRKIDAAIISSIKSKNCRCLDMGIVAQNEVLSVLALKGEPSRDYQSDTSNVLINALGIKGKVLIGDKALYYYHNRKDDEFMDLAELWKKKYGLPFVFARLCLNKHEKYLKKLTKGFLATKVKIPRYILNRYSKRSGISNKQILDYLTKISYKLSHKEKKSLKIFFKLAKKQGV